MGNKLALDRCCHGGDQEDHGLSTGVTRQRPPQSQMDNTYKSLKKKRFQQLTTQQSEDQDQYFSDKNRRLEGLSDSPKGGCFSICRSSYRYDRPTYQVRRQRRAGPFTMCREDEPEIKDHRRNRLLKEKRSASVDVDSLLKQESLSTYDERMFVINELPPLVQNESIAIEHNHPLIDIDDCLHLRKDDIKQFYHLGNELGQGSYGIVKISQRNCQASNQIYLQRIHSKSQQNIQQLQYAIKQVLIPELNSFQEQIEYEQELIELQMIKREYESLTKLEHPLLCELLEVFVDKNFIYFVNPFYTGGEVTDLMQRDDEDSLNPINEQIVKQIVYQMLKVLNYLYQKNVLHRDLKPENVMFESVFEPNGQNFIKIIDFGYSLDLNQNLPENIKKLITPWVMGTFAYTAPEQIENRNNFEEQFKIKSDMWSLGVIIYFLISGKHPFRGPTEKYLFNKILSCDYDFIPEGDWDHISENCQNLIELLIEPNINKRLSPAQALQHPWFSCFSESQIDPEVVRRLCEYRRPKAFMFIIQKIIISCFFPPESQKNVREAFLSINQSDSGEISLQELRKKLPEIDHLSILQNCSHSKNHISWSEFQVACSPIQNPHTRQSNSSEITLFTLYMHKVFGYLNVHNQNCVYLLPLNLLHVLQAQSFRYKNIDLRECISETFNLKTEQEWKNKEITFKIFYNCSVE